VWLLATRTRLRVVVQLTFLGLVRRAFRHCPGPLLFLWLRCCRMDWLPIEGHYLPIEGDGSGLKAQFTAIFQELLKTSANVRDHSRSHLRPRPPPFYPGSQICCDFCTRKAVAYTRLGEVARFRCEVHPHTPSSEDLNTCTDCSKAFLRSDPRFTAHSRAHSFLRGPVRRSCGGYLCENCYWILALGH
jgi:hypothetical protein